MNLVKLFQTCAVKTNFERFWAAHTCFSFLIHYECKRDKSRGICSALCVDNKSVTRYQQVGILGDPGTVSRDG